MTRFTATYRIETPLAVDRAAAVLAAEQSSGTFVSVPGETDELRERHGARVEKIVELDASETPGLPGAKATADGTFRRAEVVVSWPLENVGTNLPALISTVQGNLYELREFTGIRLISLNLPAEFTAAFRGPKFGVAGTRASVGVVDRPLIGTIVKPSVGLRPEQTAAMVDVLLSAGIDFIKDDELMADPPHAPFDARVRAIMDVVNRHADRTGRKAIYAFNLSDELDAMRRHYDAILAAGGTGAMISVNAVGLAATKAICDRGELVIHGHRNGWGMLTRCPSLGMDFAAYQAIQRLAGVDHLHVNGIANKFWESDDSVVRSINACSAPMWNVKLVLPVVSSGQTGLQAPQTYRLTKTVDLLYLAGGGIAAHPGGPRAGVLALQQAWEAATSGISLERHAETHVELRQTMDKFAKVGGAT